MPVLRLLALGLLLAAVLPVQAQRMGVRTDPVDRIVAVVNQEAITESELAARYSTVVRRARAQGMQLPPAAELRRQLLERMVLERVLLQSARAAGFYPSEAMIDRAVQRVAEENRLGAAQLRERLAADGLDIRSFREQIAQDIAVTRLREREVDAGIQVSEAEVSAFLAKPSDAVGGVSYDLALLTVRLPDTPSEAELAQAQSLAKSLAADLAAGADPRSLAARHANQVELALTGMRPAERLPELFVKAVARLAVGQVAPVVRSPAGLHVLRLLDREANSLAALAGVPVEQSRVRHLLIRVDEVTPEEEAFRRITDLRARIAAGSTRFEDMARQYSADGSARDGGDLGWVYSGDMVPEFERAMRALAVRELSEPVRSPFGYHLIEVLERRLDEASPERMRAQARALVRQRKLEQAFEDWQRQKRDRAWVEIRLEDS